MTNFKKLSYLFISILILASCSSDDDNQTLEPHGDYEHGILITNEGPFGTGTGTVSYISEDFSTVEASIFNSVNNSDLGNIVNSMGFSGDNGYIVVNNSHRVKVVNRYTFEHLATVETGLNNPRHFVAVGDTGYVSNWGDPTISSDDFIAIIDLTSNLVTQTIPVAEGPEKMVLVGSTVYVAHQGGYGVNNLITLVNTDTNSLNGTITVGDAPNSMVVSDANLWVLCSGAPSFTGAETPGRLVKINTGTNSVAQNFNFQDTEHPGSLCIDGNLLLYALNGGVYKLDVDAADLPTTPSSITGFFYGMTANNGRLYATDAGDFASNGTLKVYDLSTDTEIQSIGVGIIPGGIYFNE